ncbi:MAG: hypothetical protein ACTSYJ_02060 [Candidatus Thorarchaeota archaeon]
MRCLHPQCPMGEGKATWDEVLDSEGVKPPNRAISERYRLQLLECLTECNDNFNEHVEIECGNKALVKRLFQTCPCLYAQNNRSVEYRSIVHFSEISLNNRITSVNVYDAYRTQHDRFPDYPMDAKPLGERSRSGAAAGKIMEAFCEEVLSNHGIPAMTLNQDNWPTWDIPAYINLTKGNLKELGFLGDFLIPAAPSNLLISVKTEKARERLLASGFGLPVVGFGFFSEPNEFWSKERMLSYRMTGFTAIYMPENTYRGIIEHLEENGIKDQNCNQFQRELYRPLTKFGDDIVRVTGKNAQAL